MTSDRIKDVLTGLPFVPFRLHMGDGRAIDVVHPEFAALSLSGRIIVVFSPKDQMEIIDVLMIQSIEVLSQRKGRGSGRRRAG